MITVEDAFRKFRTNLETTDSEDAAASRRQRKIRNQMDDVFDIISDFLTGAYRRHTKTKPLRDIDIMIVLRDASWLDKHPGISAARSSPSTWSPPSKTAAIT